jgi:hypothetical protein
VENPSGQCRGVARIVVDGVVAHTRTIRLIDNAGICEVRVVLGAPEAEAQA